MKVISAYLYPLPAHAIVDEAGKYRGQKAGNIQYQRVDGHVRPTLVRKVDVGDGDLSQSLAGSRQNPLSDLRSPPGA